MYGALSLLSLVEDLLNPSLAEVRYHTLGHLTITGKMWL